MKTHFIKMQGCGNDFLIYDSMQNLNAQRFTQEQIRLVCDRHFGVGADGLLTLSPQPPIDAPNRSAHSGADAAWTFYNCDGSEAEMCGNAARCVMIYLSDYHFPDKARIGLDTIAGIVSGKKLSKNLAEISFPRLQPKSHQKSFSFEYEEKIVQYDTEPLRIYSINTGVPHAVIEMETLDYAHLTAVGKFLVKHEIFNPHGSNVTFLSPQKDGKIRSVTFERGVEKLTLACGTGMVAAALIFNQLYLKNFPISILTPGGETEVDYNPQGMGVVLRGPAYYVAELDFDFNDVLACQTNTGFEQEFYQ